jgi:uncharacterized protein YecT (DUF1311 family)
MMLAFSLALAAAQSAPALDCSNPVTQADMNQCEALAFRRADAELNSVWPEVRAAMQQRDREWPRGTADRRPGFWATTLESQRAWLRYRDAQCTIHGYAARGGTMESMLVSGCRRQLTEARIAELRALMEN